KNDDQATLRSPVAALRGRPLLLDRVITQSGSVAVRSLQYSEMAAIKGFPDPQSRSKLTLLIRSRTGQYNIHPVNSDDRPPSRSNDRGWVPFLWAM
ncbi:MAG: hypothetical protein CL797_03345, partial [Chromatiales bacterium]|nr:hypothetical protein [Chromatiales bacterium]